MVFIKCIASVLIFSTFVYTMIMYFEVVDTSISFKWNNKIVFLKRSPVFDAYLKKFNKSYSDEEYSTRLLYFRDSMREIHRLNIVSGARHGWTQFTDMSKKEFSNLMLMPKITPNCNTVHFDCISDVNITKLPRDIPDNFDWRTRGVISPVVNQLRCAACWAISIVETMEAMSAIRDLGRERLSIQELLDCSTYNKGCFGGNMDAMEFLCIKGLPITTEEHYPLTLMNNSCSTSQIAGGRRIKEFSITCDMDEDDILWTISHFGPVIAVVNAAPIMHYIDGIIQRSCFRSHDGKSDDHMVQIVGYDKTGNIPYYIVKNSWGELFGDQGYFKLAIGKNMCGIAEEVGRLDVY